jgi:hypothetical protein
MESMSLKSQFRFRENSKIYFFLLFKKSAVNQIIIINMVAAGNSFIKIQNYKSVDGRKLQFIL